jgi:hypothetical protein
MAVVSDAQNCPGGNRGPTRKAYVAASGYNAPSLTAGPRHNVATWSLRDKFYLPQEIVMMWKLKLPCRETWRDENFLKWKISNGYPIPTFNA